MESTNLMVPELDPQTVLTMLSQKPEPCLLDVRESREYATGHVSGTRLVPLSEIARRVHELPRDRLIICICRTGRRSRAVARQLAQSGFKTANLHGGMLRWYRNHLPIDEDVSE
jgi:rhodanese-related sulfurtransferase